MIKFAADENFNNDIVRGLLRRMPDLDIIRVQDTEFSGATDPILYSRYLRANKNQLLKASELLVEDYKNDKELTVFTAIDGEDYYE